MAKTYPRFHIGLCYLACLLLVFIYVNLFFLYKIIQEFFGDSFIKWAPLLLPPFLLLFFLLSTFKKFKRTKQKINFSWIFLGVSLSIFAFFLPDPQIAVKKIHITEYLLLSLLARYAMSHTYSSYELLIFSALFTAILGVHDEFLQGLHPSRTYGLKDMAVNICSALGGSFIWHGLGLFSASKNHFKTLSPLILYYLFWQAVSIAALAIPVSSYLNDNIPIWTTLPLSASFVIFLISYPSFQKTQYTHGVSVLTLTSMLFLFYPLLIHVLQTPFY